MGKPFKKELEKIESTIKWAIQQPCEKISTLLFDNLERPLFVVGSGGSLSACYYAACLFQKNGTVAKAITPLEVYYSKEALRNSNIIFISSSGKNTDILFAYNIAVQQEPNIIITICMSEDTPLSKLSSGHSISNNFEFRIPTKKDGFLATNSLIAYFTIFYKIFEYHKSQLPNSQITKSEEEEISNFVSKLSSDFSLTVMYGGWGQAVAYDIESKFTEAALGSILLTDYRNFGHGRHHWFAKKANKSAIVALVTPDEEKIAEKTLSLIPSDIPRLVVKSQLNSSASSIELLIKSFYLVSAVSEMQNIDPGRPGVPEFGSKLYHLRYSSFYKLGASGISETARICILRKTNMSTFSCLSEEEIHFWFKKYKDYVNTLRRIDFGSILLDYDGTICSEENRFNGPNKEIIDQLIRILKAGFIVGIATGRGQSVRKDLQKIIPKELWGNVVIGYYNGSDISTLDDDKSPNKEINSSEVLIRVKDEIDSLSIPFTEINTELRPNQITIQVQDKRKWNFAKARIQNAIMKFPLSGEVQILESSHSIDLVLKSKASKIKVLMKCYELLKKNGSSKECICIGDKGQWPGNDFELLSVPYSLSVNEVSGDPDSCWNLAEVGQKNTVATLYYLKKIELNKNSFNLKI